MITIQKDTVNVVYSGDGQMSVLCFLPDENGEINLQEYVENITNGSVKGHRIVSAQTYNNLTFEERNDGTIYIITDQNAVNLDELPSKFKTINGQSLLGEGNINITGGTGGTTDYNELTNKPDLSIYATKDEIPNLNTLVWSGSQDEYDALPNHTNYIFYAIV